MGFLSGEELGSIFRTLEKAASSFKPDGDA